MNYLLHILIYLNIYIIVALSLNLIVGYCGLLTLAQAGYFAVGSYVYAITTLRLGWGFFPSLAAGMVVAALLSILISLPSWRFKGDFFVMISLAVQALLFSAFYNWSSSSAAPGTWTNLTNGPFGIAGITKPQILAFSINSTTGMAVVSSILAVSAAIVCWLLTKSPWGRLLKCMRDDELALRGLGKNVRLTKVYAFAIASALVATAGVLYASYVSYIDPSSASLNESILMLSMVLVGGVGNFLGPLVGAFLLLVIPELLRFAQLPDNAAANLRLAAYGVALVLLVHFRPQGVAGEYRIR